MADEEKELKGDTEFSAQPAESLDVVTETPAPAPTESETVKQASPRKSRGGAWIGYTLLLATVALGGGGWLLLQELRSKQEGLGGQLSSKDQQILEVTRQVNALQSELAALHTQMVNFQSGTSDDTARFERQIADQSAQLGERIDHAQTELTISLNHIQHQLNKSRGDLMVADAEYLLSIANQKLHLIGDVKAVMKILQLSKKAGSLPLFLPHAEVDKGEENHTAAGTSPGSETRDPLNAALKDIKGLITVRRTDRPVQAILSPEQAEALREVLQLRLEAIRIALLRTDETLYQEGLTSAREWLSEHFDTQDAASLEFLAEIDKLKQQSVRVPLPDISKSLSLLRNIERLRLEMEQTSLQKVPGRKTEGKTPPARSEPVTKPEVDTDHLEESGEIQ